MSHDPNDPKIDANDERDARLDRHIDALREGGLHAEGPSPEALARTLAMLAADPSPAMRLGPDDAAAETIARPANPRGWFKMTFVQKIAAAASFAAAACLVWIMFFVFSTMGATVAYADVVEKVARARGLAYTTTVQMPGKDEGTSIRTLQGERGKVRVEMPGGRVMISDGARLITLDPVKKVATQIEPVGAPATAAAAPTGIDLVAALKVVAGGKPEPLGEQKVGGVVATGFRAPWNGLGTMVVWADAKTAQPVRIELTMQMAGKAVTSVMEHFELDPAIDASTFSTEVPAGYATETQQIDLTLATQGKVAEAVIAVLKAYADASDGALPADLNDWAALMKMDKQGKSLISPQTIGAMSGQLFSLPGGYGYAGKGVKLGDAEKIVFWYRPANAEKYRAVFGDLRIEDVDASRIPTTQPAK